MRFSHTFTWLAVAFFVPAASTLAQGDLASQAKQVFQKHCFECHGGKRTSARLNIMDHESLLQRKLVLPGKSAESELFARMLAKDESVMPPPDRDRLSAEELGIVKAWIDTGANIEQASIPLNVPVPKIVAPAPADDVNLKRPLGDSYVLQSILTDIRRFAVADRPFMRYFSLTHLLGGGTTRDELVAHRDALAKAINHLHWQPHHVRLAAIETTETVFRVDMRQLGWERTLIPKADKDTKKTPTNVYNVFDLVLLEYPYTVISSSEPFMSLAKEFLIPAAQVRPIPYVRGDWFASVATQPPLYHDLMQLPLNVTELETMLGVDAADNIKNSKAVRGGVIVSGVSRNNRVNERHVARFGHYWKSYDFKSSQAQENIFLDPINLKQSGGEMIFNLPNGLQGYYVCDEKGRRVDFAPTSIVVDTFASDKTVRNGLACMRCHDKGTKPFSDVVRPIVANLTGKASFDVTQTLSLYGEQTAIDALLLKDQDVFLKNMKQVLGKESTNEPLRAVSRRFLDDRIDLNAASAELGLAEAKNLSDVFQRGEFLQVGLAPLATGQPLARDAWELYYDRVIRLLRTGTPIPSVDAISRPDYAPSLEPPFKLEVKTNKRGNTFEPADEMILFVKSDKDVFIEIVGTSARGTKVILAPATTQIKAGKQFRFPPEGKKLLVPKGPAQESITVLASLQPFAAGEIYTGTNIADRVIHPYRLTSNGNTLQLQMSPDPVQTVKKTLSLEIR